MNNVVKTSPGLKQLLLTSSIILFCVGCDQIIKKLAEKHLAAKAPVLILNGIAKVQYVKNSGGLLGFGNKLPENWKFIIFTVLVGIILLIILLVITLHRVSKIEYISYTLILSGGISNLIDRILHQGMVTDYISLGFGNLRTGIFNLADVFITAGVLLILGLVIAKIKSPKKSSE